MIMPDIAMCKGTDCPKRLDCWRYCATPTLKRQTYFMTPPYDLAKGECEYFWPVKSDPATAAGRREAGEAER